MYLEHFGLRVLPFENVPDPAFFFNEGEYQRILRRLTNAVDSGRGLMVVAGPIGSGKTTLSQRIMADLPESTVHLWLAEPPGSDRELFQMLLQRLGARFAWDSRVLALGVLRDHLVKLLEAGGRFLVVVDESHKFSDEGLEAIRLLNNLEQGASKLVQVLMLGQEELLEMLTGTGHDEAFRQRIANLEVLGRMKPPQVHDYVRHRLRVAGGETELFPDLILDAVAEAAGGIPRLTNSLCDRALRNAFEGGKRAVDSKDLLQAAEEVGVYRKAFHFVVTRDRATVGQHVTTPKTEGAVSTPADSQSMVTGDGSNEPAPWIAPPPMTEAPFPGSDTPAVPPQRVLLVPIALLVGGIFALAASLFFFCSRAATLSPGGCIAQLAQGIFGR